MRIRMTMRTVVIMMMMRRRMMVVVVLLLLLLPRAGHGRGCRESGTMTTTSASIAKRCVRLLRMGYCQSVVLCAIGR